MNRRAREKAGIAGLAALTLAGCGVLIWILGTVLVKGLPALGWEFLTAPSSGFGDTGGIRYQILGTLLLMTGAALICLPVALGSVLFQTEFLHSPRIKNTLRMMIYSLNGVPTVVFGLAGYIVFGQILETGVSWLTGTLILAVMILPTLHVSLQEAVEAIPEHYRDAARGLGMTPYQQIVSVVLPQSVYGLVTGTLLGLARAAGETAAILFTATVFSGVTWPQTWTDPVTTLQTHILILAQESVNPVALQHAWGAGLVLLGIVFTLITATLWLRTRLHMEAER